MLWRREVSYSFTDHRQTVPAPEQRWRCIPWADSDRWACCIEHPLPRAMRFPSFTASYAARELVSRVAHVPHVLCSESESFADIFGL